MCQNSTDSQNPLSGIWAKVQGQATAQLQLSNQSPAMRQRGMSLISGPPFSGAAGGRDLVLGVAEGTEHPVVEPGPAARLEEVWADVLPDDLARVGHLEQAAENALADQ